MRPSSPPPAVGMSRVREARYLRRNLLVVLGNTGQTGDEAVEAALRAALADPDEMVQRHAAWAARQLGRVDLVGDDR